MNTAQTKERIGIIDTARFFAMALVFYGHCIEEFMLLKNPAGATQYRFIYLFHMVLFTYRRNNGPFNPSTMPLSSCLLHTAI